jgi:hypothetical protein
MLPAFPKPHRSAVKPKRLAALALARGAVSIGGILQSKAPPSAGRNWTGLGRNAPRYLARRKN